MIHEHEQPEPEEIDEFSPEIIKERLPRLRTDEIETDCLGNCYSDADEGL